MSKRFTWPWGRLSPEKRLNEINTMIERNEARIKIIEMQAREAVRLQTKNIEALKQQKKMVETFLGEGERKQLLEEAFELETFTALSKGLGSTLNREFLNCIFYLNDFERTVFTCPR